MKPSSIASSVSLRGCLLGLIAAWVAFAPGSSTARAAQSPPPIGGVTGTIATEGTVANEHAAANTIIVKTMDGMDHVFHFAKDVLIHGGKGTGPDALRGLLEGSTVVVHYTVSGSDASVQEIDRVGDEGLKVTEGIVTDVNRRRKQITIRFDNGKTEKLRLTDRAAVDAGTDLDKAAAGTKVTVYYSDEPRGRKVAHFFRKTSP